MFKQQRTIIGEGQKVQITHEDKIFSVKKQDLYNKIEILCRKKEDTELYYTLGLIIAIKAITLKDGIIYCYFQEKNIWAKRPELKIQRRSDLYKLLKGMQHFD